MTSYEILAIQRFKAFLKYIKIKGWYDITMSPKGKLTFIKILSIFYHVTVDGLYGSELDRYLSRILSSYSSSFNEMLRLRLKTFLVCEEYITNMAIKIPFRSTAEIYVYGSKKETISATLETTRIYPWTTVVYSISGQPYEVSRIATINGKPLKKEYKLLINKITR